MRTDKIAGLYVTIDVGRPTGMPAGGGQPSGTTRRAVRRPSPALAPGPEQGGHQRHEARVQMSPRLVVFFSTYCLVEPDPVGRRP